jgi:spermidine/putrescine transport system substrate-binding protein
MSTSHRVPDNLTSGLTRRRFLQGSALVGFSAFLAACAGAEESSAPGSIPIATAPPVSQLPVTSPTPQPSPTGPLKFANWPAYIDLVGKAYNTGVYKPGSSPTIEDFQDTYGVKVDYVEAIEDNKVFYAKIQPQLVAGAPTGWDLIVVTDWLAAKIISKGWAEPIDHGNVPNAEANLIDALRGKTWDASQDYHYPWQSGMTGIGFNTKQLKNAGIAEPKSLKDLYVVKADKLSFLTESRDTFGLGLLKLGLSADPASPTLAADLQAVHDDIKPLVDQGLIFTGNEYLRNFAAKRVWAAMVWSGDLASSGTAGDTFQAPEEGLMIWTDNMLIPKGAANKFTAELMINYVYDPVNAARIEDYIYYVCPVKGADAEIKKLDPGAEANPLIFPPEDYVSKFREFQFLSDESEALLDELYLDLAGG